MKPPQRRPGIGALERGVGGLDQLLRRAARRPRRAGRPSSGSAGRSCRRRRRRDRRSRRRGASMPCSAKTSRAASSTRTRLRWASARSAVVSRGEHPRRARVLVQRRSTRRARADAEHEHDEARDEERCADGERDVEAARQRLRPWRRRCAQRCDVAARRERREDRKTERAADLLRRVEEARGEPRVRRAATFVVASSVSGTNVRPMPIDITAMPGKTSLE